MLEKLATWYLTKKNVTVILNCKFNEPISIRTKDKIYRQNNDFVSGTEFLFADGNKFVLESLGESEECPHGDDWDDCPDCRR